MIAQNRANHNSSEDGELAPRPDLEILGGVGGEGSRGGISCLFPLRTPLPQNLGFPW